jgi:hypothetical protein
MMSADGRCPARRHHRPVPSPFIQSFHDVQGCRALRRLKVQQHLILGWVANGHAALSCGFGYARSLQVPLGRLAYPDQNDPASASSRSAAGQPASAVNIGCALAQEHPVISGVRPPRTSTQGGANRAEWLA